MERSDGPDADMLATVERVARFMETLDAANLNATFADHGVTIIENFAPFVFTGPGAVESWTKEFRAHAEGFAQLHHTFGTAQDFGRSGDRAFFSLPTTWTGLNHGKRFSENGGWAFVLLKQNDGWRIQNYAWAVTAMSTP